MGQELLIPVEKPSLIKDVSKEQSTLCVRLGFCFIRIQAQFIGLRPAYHCARAPVQFLHSYNWFRCHGETESGVTSILMTSCSKSPNDCPQQLHMRLNSIGSRIIPVELHSITEERSLKATLYGMDVLDTYLTVLVQVDSMVDGIKRHSEI